MAAASSKCSGSPFAARPASHTAAVASSAATSMLAQWCFTAWNIAIGRPNCRRSFAYALAVSTHSCAPPAASAAASVHAICCASGNAPRSTAFGSTSGRAMVTWPTRRVGSRPGCTEDIDAGGRCGDDHHVVPGAEHQRVGDPGPEHEPGVTIEVPVGVELQRAAEPDRGGVRTVDERGKEAPALCIVAGTVDQRRRHDSAEERARRDRTPELLEHHGELGQAITRPAELLGDVQTEPAELGEVVPERREAPRRVRRATPAPRHAPCCSPRTSGRPSPARGARRRSRSP